MLNKITFLKQAMPKALIVKLGAALVTLLLNMFAARIMGPGAYGEWQWLVSVFALGLVFWSHGFNTYGTRIAAQFGKQHFILKRLIKKAFLFSCAAGVAVFLMAVTIVDSFAAMFLAFYCLAMAMMYTQTGVLKGLGSPIKSEFLLQVFFPLLGLLFLICAAPNVEPTLMFLLQAVGAGLIALLATTLIKSLAVTAHLGGTEAKSAMQPTLSYMVLLTTSLVGALALLANRLPLLLLGGWADSVQLGVFAAVMKITMILALPVGAFNSLAGRRMVRLNSLGELSPTGYKPIAIGVLFATMIVCVLSISILMFAGQLFSVVFGEEFSVGRALLLPFLLAGLLNSIFGPVGIALLMCGHENISLRIQISTVIVSFVSFYLLVPVFGFASAGWAVFACTFWHNFVASMVCYKLYGFWFGLRFN